MFSVIQVFVSPMVVPLANPLSTAKGPGNMVLCWYHSMPPTINCYLILLFQVLISSENLNLTTFAGSDFSKFVKSHAFSDILHIVGPGAGRYATANSVLNDLIRLSQNKVVLILHCV